MNLNIYQKESRKTAVYPEKDSLNGLVYCVYGLASEAGEVAGLMKKLIRDDNWSMDWSRKEHLVEELGDALWYIANCAAELEVDLDVIAIKNIEKLKSRQERNVLHGDGDHR